MNFVGNERLQKTKREEDEQWAQEVVKFRNRAKFGRLRNFSNLEISTL